MRKRPTPIQRIRKHIVKDDKTKCWNYTLYKNVDGYGRTLIKGKFVLVHRYVFWFFKIRSKGTSWGEFYRNNKDLCVCHKCDNPSCCNPKHLFLGTPKTNSKDRDSKGRAKLPDNKGENNGQSKLTQKQAKQIYLMRGSQRYIASIFNISQTQVCGIKTKKIWKSIHMTPKV